MICSDAFRSTTDRQRSRASRRPARSCGRSTSRWRGDALLEALIAIILLAIVAVGPAYVAARMAVTHKESNLVGNAVAQLRAQLLERGNALCAGTADPVVLGNTSLEVSVQCSDRDSVEVNGRAIAVAALPRIELSVESAELFGGDGLVVVGE